MTQQRRKWLRKKGDRDRDRDRDRIGERNFRATTDTWMCAKQLKPTKRTPHEVCGAFNHIKALRCDMCWSLRGKDDVAYKRGERGGVSEVGIFRHEFYILYWHDPDDEDRQADAEVARRDLVWRRNGSARRNRA